MAAELLTIEDNRDPLVDACRQICDGLWKQFAHRLPACAQLKQTLLNRHERWVLDHFVFRTLPVGHNRSWVLQQVFEALGYTRRDSYLLPQHHVKAFWMAPPASDVSTCSVALPKIYISELVLDGLETDIQAAIGRCAQRVTPCPLEVVKEWGERLIFGDDGAVERVVSTALQWFNSEPTWKPLDKNIYTLLSKECPFGAWVAAFGNCVGQVGVAAYLMNGFSSLADFNNYLIDQVKMSLDTSRGHMIQGAASAGYHESTLLPMGANAHFTEGPSPCPFGTLAFGYRYPLPGHKADGLWSSLYQGFGVDKF